jgi:putative phage-type endonuclease
VTAPTGQLPLEVPAPPSPGRRVTPTARLVLPASASRVDWLAARRRGIGASDAPAILGVEDFGSPRHVYYDKTGQLGDNAGDAAHWGSLLEEPIAREWARRNRSVVQRVGLVAHIDDPVLMTTLDRRITECPLPETRRETCALEIKCRSAFKGGRWDNGAPDDVLAQILFQLAVTGYDHVHYAVLVGGNDYRQGVIRRADHENTTTNIVTACRKFWDTYVAPGVVPPQSEHGAREIAMYRRLNPEPEGYVDLDDDDDVLGALWDYEVNRLAEAAARKKKELAQAELLRLLGTAQQCFLNKELAYSLESNAGRPSTDYERLAERWPEAYRECVSRKPFTQLSIDAAYRHKPKKES